jgi:predicted negative regulator of RcsB-dependent stress response
MVAFTMVVRNNSCTARRNERSPKKMRVARRDAEIVVDLSQENALTLYAIHGALQSAWASARLEGCETGAMEFRQALAAFTDQGIKAFVPFFQGLIAEIEARGDSDGALTRIDESLALAPETGERWSDTFLHRLRGEILLKRNPVNMAPAEDALLTAIAVAHPPKARSFELRAALSLAKLYHSTDRPADAHAVLASALKGFSPTPEFPEIAEAQTLLSVLASCAKRRSRRLPRLALFDKRPHFTMITDGRAHAPGRDRVRGARNRDHHRALAQGAILDAHYLGASTKLAVSAVAKLERAAAVRWEPMANKNWKTIKPFEMQPGISS